MTVIHIDECITPKCYGNAEQGSKYCKSCSADSLRTELIALLEAAGKITPYTGTSNTHDSNVASFYAALERARRAVGR